MANELPLPSRTLPFSITLGSDVEVFLRDEDGNHDFPSGITTGTKATPEVIADDLSVQRDGMALEFNFEPKTCHNTRDIMDFFHTYTETYLKRMRKFVHERTGGKYSISKENVVKFDKEVLDRQDPYNLESGCSPYNVAALPSALEGVTYQMTGAPVYDFENGRHLSHHRVAGGHVHIGFDYMNGRVFSVEELEHECVIIAALLGTLTRYFYRGMNDYRRNLEVRAGLYPGYATCSSFRKKAYGIEYRYPTNAWLFSPKSKLLISKCLAHLLFAMRWEVDRNEFFRFVIRYPQKFSPHCSFINESETSHGKSILRNHGVR